VLHLLFEKAQVKIYANKEISTLYQCGKVIFKLIEGCLNFPLISIGNSDIGIFSSSYYDDGLPKLGMDSPLLNNHEI
jgi:hypothetical protein